jgi:hypothetical protein
MTGESTMVRSLSQIQLFRVGGVSDFDMKFSSLSFVPAFFYTAASGKGTSRESQGGW